MGSWGSGSCARLFSVLLNFEQFWPQLIDIDFGVLELFRQLSHMCVAMCITAKPRTMRVVLTNFRWA